MKLKKLLFLKSQRKHGKKTHGDGGARTEDFVANLKHGNFDLHFRDWSLRSLRMGWDFFHHESLSLRVREIRKENWHLDLKKSNGKCVGTSIWFKQLELRVPLLNSRILRYQSPSKWCPRISSLGRCACRTCRSGSWMDGEVFNGRYLETSLHCALRSSDILCWLIQERDVRFGGQSTQKNDKLAACFFCWEKVFWCSSCFVGKNTEGKLWEKWGLVWKVFFGHTRRSYPVEN